MPRPTGNPKKNLKAEQKPEPPINNQRRLFIEAYLGDCKCSVKAAADVAGYNHDYAYQMIKIPEIAEEIKNRLEETKMSTDRLLGIVEQQAEVCMGDFLDSAGNIDPQKLKDPRLKHAVAEYTVTMTKNGPAYKLVLLKDSALGRIERISKVAGAAKVDVTHNFLGLTDEEVNKLLDDK